MERHNEMLRKPIVTDNLLLALVGIEGWYDLIKRFHGRKFDFTFQINAFTDSTPQFVESKSQFETILVIHVFATALCAFLLDYPTVVA